MLRALTRWTEGKWEPGRDLGFRPLPITQSVSKAMATATAQDIARRLGIPLENMIVVGAEDADDADDDPKEPLAVPYIRDSFFDKVRSNNKAQADKLPCATLVRQDGFASTPIAYATFRDYRSLCRVLSCANVQLVPMQGNLEGFVAWFDEQAKLNGARRNKEAETLLGDMVHGKIHGDVLLTRKAFDPANPAFVSRFKAKTKLKGFDYGSAAHKAWMRKMCEKHKVDYEEDNYELHLELEEIEEKESSEQMDYEDPEGNHNS